MTAMDQDKRKALAALRRQIKELEKPELEAFRKKRRDEHRRRVKAIGKPAKGQRQPRVREPLYLAWIRRQPCLHCGKTPCDAAHIRFVPQGSGWSFPGIGAKPSDFRCVPLCREAHTLQHSMNECKFWQEVLCLDPVDTVNKLRAKYFGEMDR